eukprot:TRINITY_DN7360_c0_g1_i1.p2 TRINITY_DN7360_c0_g1~~TRINITY_DN7360_c0_g1_i1.p2  ORF type:complete len:110 (-),score=48.64 TRINITY_DN7360_c0_g1_i1:25-354(-)
MCIRDSNSRDGFLFECFERLGADHAERAFNAFNSAFAWLPIAAHIQHAIFCVHGGPGRLKTIAELEALPRGGTNVESKELVGELLNDVCLLYTSPSPRDRTRSRMPSSA